MPNGFIYVVDAHFVDKIEEKYPIITNDFILIIKYN
jgi:hypothetical protein